MAKTNFKHLLSYSLLGVFLIIGLGVVSLVYDGNKPPEKTDSFTKSETKGEELNESSSWQTIYPNTVPMQIGSTTLRASVASTWPERIKGLSDTPYLPEDVVKFFAFDSLGLHSIWMKDMNYSIDIIWLNEEGVVVYIVNGASPESYPAMFVPDTKAKYVVETVEGFAAKNNITVGTTTVLPNF